MSAARSASAGALQSGRLVGLIRDQAEAEAHEIRTQAEEHAARLKAQADAEAEAVRAAAREEGRRRGDHDAAARIAVAEADSRRQWLWAREEIIEEVLRRAREELAALACRPDADGILADLIAEGLGHLPPGPVRVVCPAEYAPLVAGAVRRQLPSGPWTCTFVTGEVPGGGVIVESEDGRLRFDNSFEARLRRRALALRFRLSELLSDERSEPLAAAAPVAHSSPEATGAAASDVEPAGSIR